MVMVSRQGESGIGSIDGEEEFSRRRWWAGWPLVEQRRIIFSSLNLPRFFQAWTLVDIIYLHGLLMSVCNTIKTGLRTLVYLIRYIEEKAT